MDAKSKVNSFAAAKKRPKAGKIQEFVAHSENVTCAHIGRKSARVYATGGADSVVKLWKLGKTEATTSLPQSKPVDCVRFDASETLVMAGTSAGSIKLWDCAEAKCIRTLTGHLSSIRCVEFHPFGDFVASGSLDTTLKIWDTKQQKNVQTLKGHSHPITALKHSPDGNWVVAGDAGGCVKVWDLTAGRALCTLAAGATGGKSSVGGLDEITSIEFHPVEFWLAVSGGFGADRQRCVGFWDLEDISKPSLVASTAREATKVRSILFHKGYFFAASLETLKAWSWDPMECHDVIDVGWSNLADLASTQKEDLYSISLYKSTVAIHTINLSHLPDRTRPEPVTAVSAGVAPNPGRAASSIDAAADRHSDYKSHPNSAATTAAAPVPKPVSSKSQQSAKDAAIAAARDAAAAAPVATNSGYTMFVPLAGEAAPAPTAAPRVGKSPRNPKVAPSKQELINSGSSAASAITAAAAAAAAEKKAAAQAHATAMERQRLADEQERRHAAAEAAAEAERQRVADAAGKNKEQPWPFNVHSVPTKQPPSAAAVVLEAARKRNRQSVGGAGGSGNPLIDTIITQPGHTPVSSLHTAPDLNSSSKPVADPQKLAQLQAALQADRARNAKEAERVKQLIEANNSAAAAAAAAADDDTGAAAAPAVGGYDGFGTPAPGMRAPSPKKSAVVTDPLIKFQPPAARYPGQPVATAAPAVAVAAAPAVVSARHKPASAPVAAAAESSILDDHDDPGMSFTLPDPEQVRTDIETSHRQILKILRARHANLIILQGLWSSGNVRACFETAAPFETGVIYDFLSACESSLTGYNLLTLDMCGVIVKLLHKLLRSKFDVHNVLGLRLCKVLLLSFTPMIHDTLSSAASASSNAMISLSREDRVTRCTEAVELFQAIETDTDAFTQPHRSKELNILAREVRKLIAKLLRRSDATPTAASGTGL